MMLYQKDNIQVMLILVELKFLASGSLYYPQVFLKTVIRFISVDTEVSMKNC